MFERRGQSADELPTPEASGDAASQGIVGERGAASVDARKRRPIGALVIVVAGCLAVLGMFMSMADKPRKTPKAELATSPFAPDSERKPFRERETSLPAAPAPPVGGPPVLPEFKAPPLPKIEPREEPRRNGDTRTRELTPQERRMHGGVSGLSAASGAAPGRAAAAQTPVGGRVSAAGSGRAPALVRTTGDFGGAHDGQRETASADADESAKGSRSNSLEEQLVATKKKGTKAASLPSMTMMLARGRLIECTLDTAISSVVAGQVRCTVPVDIYGEDGKVVLLDRGTEIVGEYRSDLKRAQKRLGILWNRAKTPQGVLIDLDSPASDTLGRAGVDGFVETHFWERFGAAMMLSVLDDALAAVLKQSQGGGNNFYLGNSTRQGRGLAETALRDSISIPPTLVKNQGETVQIFLARDLDFRDIYDYRQLGLR